MTSGLPVVSLPSCPPAVPGEAISSQKIIAVISEEVFDMTTLRRSWLIVTCLLLTIFTVACGSNSGSNSSTMGNTNTTMGNNMGAASPTATMGGNQMMGATPTTVPMATPTTTTMGNNTDALIHVGHVMLNGKSV